MLVFGGDCSIVFPLTGITDSKSAARPGSREWRKYLPSARGTLALHRPKMRARRRSRHQQANSSDASREPPAEPGANLPLFPEPINWIFSPHTLASRLRLRSGLRLGSDPLETGLPPMGGETPGEPGMMSPFGPDPRMRAASRYRYRYRNRDAISMPMPMPIPMPMPMSAATGIVYHPFTSAINYGGFLNSKSPYKPNNAFIRLLGAGAGRRGACGDDRAAPPI